MTAARGTGLSGSLAQRTIALIVGDTAGHTYPALAVADALRRRQPSLDVLFIGSEGSPAAAIVHHAGETWLTVRGAPIRRQGLAGLPIAAVETMRGFADARRLLRDRGVDLAIGFGGFASGGALLAARSLGVATAIHEANVEPGLANRWLQHIVTRVYVAHAGTLRGVTVGQPVRPDVSALADIGRTPPAAPLLRVLVVSGSRGTTFFDRVVPEVVKTAIAAGLRIELQQQATADAVATLRANYTALQVDAEVTPHIDDMAAAYRRCDVAIARAGAGTLAELAVAGVPALVVPLADAAADHQAANARGWADAGAGPMMRESAWNRAAVNEWLLTMTSAARWKTASAAARSLADPGAAGRMAADCLTLISAR